MCIETELSGEGLEASSLRAGVLAGSVCLAFLGVGGQGLAWALLVSLVVDIGEVIEQLTGCSRSPEETLVSDELTVLSGGLLRYHHEMSRLGLLLDVRGRPDRLGSCLDGQHALGCALAVWEAWASLPFWAGSGE